MSIEGYVIYKKGVGYMTDSSPAGSGSSQRLFAGSLWDDRVPLYDSVEEAEDYLTAGGRTPAQGIEIHEIRARRIKKY